MTAPSPDAAEPDTAEQTAADDDFDDESPPWIRRARGPRRPVAVRVVIAVVATAAVLLVVLGLWRAAPERNLVVPTAAHSAGVRSLAGSVSAARTRGHVCFWIDAPGGRYWVVAPRGWTADSALRLLDRFGRVRLIAGTRAVLVGSAGGPAHFPGCPGSGRAWYTADVRADG